MLDQSTLANFTTVIACFASIGGIIDTLTVKYRASSEFSTKQSNYYEVLSVFYYGFYDRLLPGKPTSKKYLARSFLLSVFFFVFIYSFLCWHTEQPTNLIFDGWSFQLTLAFFYVAIFWLISAQTKLFISESLRAESRLSRAVFIVSDVLASSNIFIFLFSAGLLLGANVFSTFALNSISNNSDTSVLINFTKQPSKGGLEYVSGDSAFKYSVEVIPLLNGEENYNVSPRTRFTLYSNRLYLGPQMFVPENGFESVWTETSGSISGNEIISSNDIQVEVEERPSVTYSYTFSLPAQNYTLPMRFYAEAYKIIDRVEDGFWEILQAHLLFASPHDLYHITGGFSPFDFEPLCLVEKTNFIVSADVKLPHECIDDIFIISGSRLSSSSYKNVAVLDKLDFWFPVSAYFISCMALSVMFYGAVFITYILRLIRSTALVSNTLRGIYKTAPFTLGAVILGIFAWFSLIAF